MNKAKPKRQIMYYIGITFKCYIHCFPQQIWEVERRNNKICLSRKNVAFEITEADFKERWKMLNNDVV